jgi:hypothetical protein
MHFKHLIYAKQGYFEHFYDSIRYSGKALKAFWYFTVHAFLPDFYDTNGSTCIKDLNDILQEKLSKIKQEQQEL